MVRVKIHPKAIIRKLDPLCLLFTGKGRVVLRKWRSADHPYPPNAIAVEDLVAGGIGVANSFASDVISEVRNMRP